MACGTDSIDDAYMTNCDVTLDHFGDNSSGTVSIFCIFIPYSV